MKFHLNGACHMSRAATPHVRKQRGRSPVRMTFTSGFIGDPAQANEGAAKMCVVALSKAPDERYSAV